MFCMVEETSNMYYIVSYYSVSQLSRLEILVISSNFLNTVPAVVSSLTSLRELNMRNCGLSDLMERFVFAVFVCCHSLILFSALIS